MTHLPPTTSRMSASTVPGVDRSALAEPRSITDAWAAVDADQAPPPRRGWQHATGLPALLVAADLLALAAAMAAVPLPASREAVFVATALLSRACLRLYRRRLHLSVLDELPRALGSVLIAAGALLAVAALAPVPTATPPRLLGLVAAFAAASLVAHAGIFATIRTIRRRRGATERTLIIGAGRVGTVLAHALLEHPELGMRPVGFADADALTAPQQLPLPVLATDLSRLSRVLVDARATTVVIAFSADRESHLVDTVITAHQGGCDVLVVPRMFELHHDGPDVERVRGIPLIRLRPDPTLRPTWWVKRVLDVSIGVLGLVIVFPLLAVLALAALVESGRPVLFWQERVGLDHRLFRLCKFRSMRPRDETESATQWTIANDPRVGPVGRFLRRTSLDELPQLWNIARGDMSLVGPRPERAAFVRRFSHEHERYWARHRVPVGLTGLAQVNGLRGDTSIRERARYDDYYIADWSLWLDVKIVLLTVREVLRGGGR